MLHTISSREKQFRAGIISQTEYINWMKDNFPNLTMGDWTQISDFEDVLDAKNDAESLVADLSAQVNRLKEAAKVKHSATDVETGEWVVIHTSVNYTPNVTVINECEFDDYFNEGNGFQDDWEIDNIRVMESGHSMQIDMGNAITIVRV